MTTHGSIKIYDEDKNFIYMHTSHDGHTFDAFEMILSMPFRILELAKEGHHWIKYNYLENIQRADFYSLKGYDEFMLDWNGMIPIYADIHYFSTFITFSRGLAFWYVVPSSSFSKMEDNYYQYPNGQDIDIFINKKEITVDLSPWLKKHKDYDLEEDKDYFHQRVERINMKIHMKELKIKTIEKGVKYSYDFGKVLGSLVFDEMLKNTEKTAQQISKEFDSYLIVDTMKNIIHNLVNLKEGEVQDSINSDQKIEKKNILEKFKKYIEVLYWVNIEHKEKLEEIKIFLEDRVLEASEDDSNFMKFQTTIYSVIKGVLSNFEKGKSIEEIYELNTRGWNQ